MKIIQGYHQYQNCIEACLRCAAICNHCASSCTQEEDLKMMARCIQLDMECAAICYAAAQLMSLGSKKLETFAVFVQGYARHVEQNVKSIKTSIARSVQGFVVSAQKNAARWRLK